MSPSGGAIKRDRDAVQAKLAQVRKQQQSQERRRTALIVGSAAAVVIALVAAVTVTIVREQSGKPDLAAVKSYPATSEHVTTAVTYAQSPPAGGKHAPVWLDCGIYDKPVPNENAVHSMEHGAVWVTYRDDLPAAQVDLLRRSLTDTYLVLSPYQGLPSPVMASAWGKQIALTGPDDQRLTEFVRTYRQGAQSPEPGAACTGGTDGSSAPGSES